MASAESSGFMTSAENSNSENPLSSRQFESSCPRAQKLIDEATSEIPGPLDANPLPEIAKFWLTDLASEVTKGHLTVGDAHHLYCIIQQRFEISLMRYGGFPKDPSFTQWEDKKLRLFANFLQGAELFLYCLDQLQAAKKQSDFKLPSACQ